MRKLKGEISMTRFIKILLCLITVLAAVLLLPGCEDEDKPGWDEAKCQYIDSNGNPIPTDQIDLEFIADNLYDRKFDKLDLAQRQAVITRYLKCHLPANSEGNRDYKQEMIAQISALSFQDMNLPSDFENNLKDIEGLLTETSTVLSLAGIYAQAKEDDAFGKFIDKVDGVVNGKVVGTALKLSKACCIIADLANNDISDKEEYCCDLIDALKEATGYIPYWGDYFDTGLSIIQEEVKVVIKCAQYHLDYSAFYLEEVSKSTFFGIKQEDNRLGESDQILFERIIQPIHWINWREEGRMDSACPSIAEILAKSDEFDKIPIIYKEDKGQLTKISGYAYLRNYILERIDYELAYPEHSRSRWFWDQTESVPDVQECEHNWEDVYVQEPTCTALGYINKICSICDEGDITIIKVLPHDYMQTVIAPTYDAQGYTLYECKWCGDSYTDSFTGPLTIGPPDISVSNTWYALGEIDYRHERFFEFRVDSVSEDAISGYLEVFRLDSGNRIYKHQTAFTGTGSPYKDGYKYLLLFEQSVTFGISPTFTYSEMEIYYNAKKDTFTFDLHYHVTMPHILPPQTGTWTEKGIDDYYDSASREDHVFILNIYGIDGLEIQGYLEVWENDRIENCDHRTAFTGIGTIKDGIIQYEILLQTPRTETLVDGSTITVDKLILNYNPEKNTFEMSDGMYQVCMKWFSETYLGDV